MHRGGCSSWEDLSETASIARDYTEYALCDVKNTRKHIHTYHVELIWKRALQYKSILGGLHKLFFVKIVVQVVDVPSYVVRVPAL